MILRISASMIVILLGSLSAAEMQAGETLWRQRV